MDDPYLSHTFKVCSAAETLIPDEYRCAPIAVVSACRGHYEVLLNEIMSLLGEAEYDGVALAHCLRTTRIEPDEASSDGRVTRTLQKGAAYTYPWLCENLAAVLKMMVQLRMIKIAA